MKFLRFFFLSILLSCYTNFLYAQQLTQSNLAYLQSLPIDIQQKFQNQTTEESQMPEVVAIPNIEESIEDQDKKMNLEDQVFGYSFFKNSPSTLRETYNEIPLMSDYQLSINDELDLTITGSLKALYKVRINLGGSIQIPEIGEINLYGLTLSEADDKISQIISDSFVGAKSVLSIRKASLKKISIVGSVKKPGTYMVNPYTSVSQAINYAGGLEENASLRTIEVIGFEGEKRTSDLYQFLIFGNRKQDLSLQNGDTVFIKPTSNFVKVYGEVHRPMKYEYIEGDKFIDLVNFAQGTTNNANLNKVAINALSEGMIITKPINLSNKVEKDIIESLLVPRIFFLQNKDIEIEGKNVSSGFIPSDKYKNLSELIDSIKFGQDIYPFFFRLEQTTNDGLTVEKYNLSLHDPKTYESIVLKSNVKITFFSRLEIFHFNEIQNESADNSLLNEDELKNFLASNLKFSAGDENFNLPIAGKYTVQSLIDYLGVGNEIDINNGSITNANGSFFTEILNEKFSFSDGTVINFPKLETSKSISVTIQGEVLFPGTYEVNQNATLNDLYEIAGGFTSRADERAIFFSRESIKGKERQVFNNAKKLIFDVVISSISSASQSSSIQPVDASILTLIESIGEDDFQGRLAGDLRFNSITAKTTLLEQGDTLTIPSQSNTIAVIGEVLSPTSMVFEDSLMVSNYISKSGGYTRFADKQNVYIISADGTSRIANSRLFSDPYYLQPGDTIVVPRNLEKISTIPLISVATRIISDIAFSAASLNALNNN